MTYTVGSLFDGSGGFPLAAFMCGGVPVWASEIEPYPIAVTKTRFPYMKHLGDISKINGAEIEPVDVITFGSPCQDLSVAGKRAGLKHEVNGDEETTRSGLFMEAVRIIKEMRDATDGKYPRFALWENVPGAFSSNKGEDFRVVLEELIKIVEPTATMPAVPKTAWAYADSYSGHGWSLAYRVLDAQYWGVPQRRRRIFLVFDFGGGRAREVLFERQGLRRDFKTGRTPWKRTPGYAEGGSGADDSEGEVGRDLAAVNFAAGFLPKQSANARSLGYEEELAPALLSDHTGAVVYDARGNGDGDIVGTLTGDHENRITDYTAIVVYESHPMDSRIRETGDVSPTVSVKWHKGAADTPLVCAERPVYCLQGNGIDRADTAGCNGRGWTEDVCYTLNTIDRPAVVLTLRGDKVAGALKARDYKGVGREDSLGSAVCICFDKEVYNSGINGTGGHYIAEEGPAPTLRAGVPPGVSVEYIVRRLTPTECARLQGFPDRWGDIDEKEHFTEDEYNFWLDVRNTHAEINGKQVKDYTEKQMLAWYSRLHTDSSEYKMWGNGIALPTAMYVMEGITEVLKA